MISRPSIMVAPDVPLSASFVIATIIAISGLPLGYWRSASVEISVTTPAIARVAAIAEEITVSVADKRVPPSTAVIICSAAATS